MLESKIEMSSSVSLYNFILVVPMRSMSFTFSIAILSGICYLASHAINFVLVELSPRVQWMNSRRIVGLDYTIL